MDATTHASLANPPARFRAFFADARVFQIVFLGSLLAAGALLRDFSVRPVQVALTFSAALTAQHVDWWLNPLKPRSYRSALITSLSLALLLRAENFFAHPLAASAAISSKGIFRIRGKHLFNPATFGIIFALTTLPGVWVSPGQWGNDVALAGWLFVLGTVVTQRARRGGISFAFLGFYLGAIALRVAYLGQPWGVWTHQLQSGALLLFAFFMISDPMTAPNHPRGRIAHAGVVATAAFAWQYEFYFTNGLIWALFIASPAVAPWDVIWPAPKFEWKAQGGNDEETKDAGVGRRGIRSDDARGIRRAA
ncbi:MAG: RnfABCDGE type electron transport complex subunit D [Candidatus Binataceae bacterium]